MEGKWAENIAMVKKVLEMDIKGVERITVDRYDWEKENMMLLHDNLL